MLELYHNPFSTCSQKVRLALAEKQLEFVSHEIDLLGGQQHDPEYVKLNPNHVVPTLVHDGRVFVESTLINEYIDEAFEGPGLRPVEAAGRYAVRLWTHMLDARIHPAAPVITFAMGPRSLLLAQPEDVREANIAAIPDARHREIRRSVLAHGVEAPEFLGALRTMIDMLDRAEQTLATQPWLSGEAFGLADAGVLPYVLRLDHLAMDALLAPEARARVADWYARVQARESYAAAVAAWLPEPLIDFMRAQGRELWPTIEARLAGKAN